MGHHSLPVLGRMKTDRYVGIVLQVVSSESMISIDKHPATTVLK